MTFPYLRSSEQVVLTSFTSEHSTIPFDSGNSSLANQLYLSRRNSGTSAFGFPHRNRPCIISRASKNFIAQIYLTRAPGDPQILEAASDRKNRRLLLVQTLLGGNARDDAIRGHHVENVQPLDRRGYRGVKGVILRVAAGASHRIRRFVRNDFL